MLLLSQSNIYRYTDTPYSLIVFKYYLTVFLLSSSIKRWNKYHLLHLHFTKCQKEHRAFQAQHGDHLQIQTWRFELCKGKQRQTGIVVRDPSHTRYPVSRRTRQGSPSPPRLLNTKFVRKKAPNWDHLYHYKLWSPHNTTYPRFANKHLSAQDALQYLTGTVSNDDVITPNNTVIITAHGLSSYRKITIKPNFWQWSSLELIVPLKSNWFQEKQIFSFNQDNLQM